MNFDNNFCLQRERLSDGKILYFRDMESMEDYVKANGGEDAYGAFYFDTKPFTEPLIDNYEHRSELERMLNFSGISTNDLTTEEIEGIDKDNYKAEDTEKRLKEIYKNEKVVQKLNKDTTITITDEAPDEITARQGVLNIFKMFKYDYEHSDDEQKKIYEDVLKEHNMNINDFDTYIDEAINADFSIFSKEFDSKEEMQKAKENWAEIDSVKKLTEYKKGLTAASDAVYKYSHDKFLEEHKDEIEAEKEKHKDEKKKAYRIDDTFLTDAQFLLGTRFVFMIKFEVIDGNTYSYIDDYYLSRLSAWIQEKVSVKDFIQTLNEESRENCSKATIDVNTHGRNLIIVVNAYQDIPKHRYETCKDSLIALVQDIISDVDGETIPNDTTNRKVIFDEDIYFSYDASVELTVQEGIEKLSDKLQKYNLTGETSSVGMDKHHGFSDFEEF